MQVIDDAWKLQESVGPTVVTIGNFDGLHLGQQAVLQTVKERARDIGARPTVVTFEPHPLTILRPERPPERLTTPEQKRHLLGALGIDLMAVVRFTEEFAATGATEFIEQFVHRRLGAREVYVGASFGFGRQREGDLALLAALADRLGFRAAGVDEIRASAEIISSTRIRQVIRAGEMQEAAALLGRTYAMTGRVIHGEGRGREQGWPTINLEPDPQLLPPDGVYASQVWIPVRRKVYGAVTNIGQRPTFPGDQGRVVESHIFDFGREVYRERVELGFVRRLRREKKFPSIAELVAQIDQDATRAREYLAQEGCSTLLPTLRA
jgi:riboflavin kinase/FMN adenylyltransferase